jgi:putative transposase
MSRVTSRGDAPVSLLCEAFGLSRAAYYAAKTAPARSTSNVVALPRTSRHATAEAILTAIRAVLVEWPSWGVRKVWAVLRRDHDLVVSRKRVWAIMRANNLVLERGREPGDPPRGHVVTPEPNRRLATDMTLAWTREDGWVAIMPTIDCGCRTILGILTSRDQDAPTLLASVRMALVAVYGSPEAVPDGLELRTDHGPQYTGSECEALVAHWRMTHTYAPVGRPTGNAVVERVIRTLKEDVIWPRDWRNAEEVRAAVDAWVVAYNTRRPHQALGWKTPAEYRAERLAAMVPIAA